MFEVTKVFSWNELEGKTLKIILARETKEGPIVIAGVEFVNGISNFYVLEIAKEAK
jgi:hypothetical protein